MGLLVPPSAVERDKPNLRCNVCKREFPASQEQQWQRHVIACARKNEELVDRAVYHKREADHVLGIGDEEKHTWVRQRKAEGRLKRSDIYDRPRRSR